MENKNISFRLSDVRNGSGSPGLPENNRFKKLGPNRNEEVQVGACIIIFYIDTICNVV